jgi:hypothetical protein
MFTTMVYSFFNRNVLFPRTGDPILYEWGSRYVRNTDELALAEREREAG